MPTYKHQEYYSARIFSDYAMRLARKSRGVSQAKLSQITGIPLCDLRRMEWGLQKFPDDAVVELIAAALDFMPKFFWVEGPDQRRMMRPGLFLDARFNPKTDRCSTRKRIADKRNNGKAQMLRRLLLAVDTLNELHKYTRGAKRDTALWCIGTVKEVISILQKVPKIDFR